MSMHFLLILINRLNNTELVVFKFSQIKKFLSMSEGSVFPIIQGTWLNKEILYNVYYCLFRLYYRDHTCCFMH